MNNNFFSKIIYEKILIIFFFFFTIQFLNAAEIEILSEIPGTGPKIINHSKIKVNSAHHQAINKLGKNLIISGLARDGIIESIESTEHDWCIGVQWHPEFLITKADKLLISNFIEFSQKKL